MQNIGKLNKENYKTWNKEVEVLLVREKLWDIVSGKQLTNNAAGMKKDNEAKEIIRNLLDNDHINHLTNLKTSNDYWMKLQVLNKKSTFMPKIKLMQEFKNFNYTNENSMENHIKNLEKIIKNLENFDVVIPENLIILNLLSSLPVTYNDTILKLELQTDIKLSLVKSILIQQEKELKKSINLNCKL